MSHAAFLRLQLKLVQETLNLEVSGSANFSTEEWFARPLISYAISDALLWSVGGVIYGGKEGTLFRTIQELQSAGFMEFKLKLPGLDTAQNRM